MMILDLIKGIKGMQGQNKDQQQVRPQAPVTAPQPQAAPTVMPAQGGKQMPEPMAAGMTGGSSAGMDPRQLAMIEALRSQRQGGY
jgi:hypothetical protein